MNIGKILWRGLPPLPESRAGALIFAADYSQHALNCNAAPCRNGPEILSFLVVRLAVLGQHRYSSGRKMNSA